MGYRIAVVGATGNVGREMLRILDERDFPAESVAALASERSLGQKVELGEKELDIQALDGFDFSGIDIALFAAGSSISRQWAGKVGEAGAVVIDNASCFRMEPDVPLIVPEVNPDAIEGYRERNLIANPNCSTAQLVLALKPLHDYAGIRRVSVATYQSVSGAGKQAMDDLFEQTRAFFASKEIEGNEFNKQIAFNVLPHIGAFLEDGSSEEEWKMMAETSKIMGEEIPLVVTCVRVPVFIGHSEAVHIEFERPVDVEQAREVLRAAPGCEVVDISDEGGYVTPVECVGSYATFISRLRRDPTVEHGLSLWVVSDNLRKGAALNAVQIAELLLQARSTD